SICTARASDSAGRRGATSASRPSTCRSTSSGETGNRRGEPMIWMRALPLIALAVASALDPSLAAAGPSGKITIAQGVDPSTLDPMNHQESPAGNVCRNMFDTLLERDQELKIQPMLARELPRLVSPTVRAFKLRPGAKFPTAAPVDAHADESS